MAKAALNQQSITLQELRKAGENIDVVSVNPGFVAIKLTDFDFDDDMDTCIERIAKVIGSVDNSKTGRFIDWTKEELPF